MPGSFFDTNVLVYIASGDPLKADRAEAIIADGGVISVQVLNELTNVARRKMRMTWPDIHIFLSMLRGLLSVRPVTIQTHETGLVHAAGLDIWWSLQTLQSSDLCPLFGNHLLENGNLAQQHDHQLPKLGRRQSVKVFRRAWH